MKFDKTTGVRPFVTAPCAAAVVYLTPFSPPQKSRIGGGRWSRDPLDSPSSRPSMPTSISAADPSSPARTQIDNLQTKLALATATLTITSSHGNTYGGAVNSRARWRAAACRLFKGHVVADKVNIDEVSSSPLSRARSRSMPNLESSGYQHGRADGRAAGHRQGRRAP